MTDFYSGLQNTAAALVNDKGRQMTLTKRTPGAYDPTTGAAAVTTEDHAVNGAAFAFPSQMIDGTMILAGDKRVIVSALGMTVDPDAGDELTIGADVHRIIAAKEVNPAGTRLIWVLQVRK